MEVALASYGIAHAKSLEMRSSGVLWRMPVVQAAASGTGFAPDVALLLLCDRLIVDELSWDALCRVNGGGPLSEVAEVLRLIEREGFIRVEDYDSIVANKRETLSRMLEYDLKRIRDWVVPLREQRRRWAAFVAGLHPNVRANVFDPGSGLAAARTSQADRSRRVSRLGRLDQARMFNEVPASPGLVIDPAHRRAVRSAVIRHLAYVNANLAISSELGVSMHDWADYDFFYREKFLAIGREQHAQHEGAAKLQELFCLSFPEFSHWTPKAVMKAITDRRIQHLRSMVARAAGEKQKFDSEFARRTLLEVLQTERRVTRFRSIVSYLTLPLGFIPCIGTPIQKATEELACWLAGRRQRGQHAWFYLLSDFGAGPSLKGP